MNKFAKKSILISHSNTESEYRSILKEVNRKLKFQSHSYIGPIDIEINKLQSSLPGLVKDAVSDFIDENDGMNQILKSHYVQIEEKLADIKNYLNDKIESTRDNLDIVHNDQMRSTELALRQKSQLAVDQILNTNEGALIISNIQKRILTDPISYISIVASFATGLLGVALGVYIGIIYKL